MGDFIKKLFFFCIIFCALNLSSVFAQNTDLEILHTNDVHGRLLPYTFGGSNNDELLGGVARRFTLINEIRQQTPKTFFLLLDSGDIAQGSMFFNIYNGIPDIEFMNEQGYDAATIGNHEFDKGSLILSELVDKAKFPFLAANLQFDKQSPLYGKIKPYLIKDFNNIKVGIIGIVTDEIKLLSNIGKYTKVLNPVKSVKKYIKEIDKDTDVIIILSHFGYDNDKYLASRIKNADIIIGGHSHTAITSPAFINDLNKHPIIIVQAGEFGRFLGDLKVKVADDQVSFVSYKLHTIDSSISPDSLIVDKLKSFQDQIDKSSQIIIGKTLTSINFIRDEVRGKETSGGNFVVDAIKNKFPETDIVFQNGGGIRKDIIIPPGNITLADVLEIHPFDDEIILFDLSGKDIKSTLERSVASLPYSYGGFLQVSGITFVVDVSKPPQVLTKDYQKIKREGSRVRDIFINGKSINLNKTYRIAANTFLVNGGNGFWSMRNSSKHLYNSGITVTDILEEYLKNHSPVSPTVGDRIKVVNIPKMQD